VLKHEPVKTSEEAAKVRGVSLASGAKAMLLFKKEKNVGKIPLENYILAVMSAEKKFSWKAVRKELSCK
jgi:Ala-tRNA(Pro) deacylase